MVPEKMHAYRIVMPAEVPPPADHPRGLHALLMLMQLVLGAVCIGLVADLGSYQAPAELGGSKFMVSAFISFGEATALLLVSYGCLFTSGLLLAASLLAPASYARIPRSLFFVLYHLISASLYLCTGLSVVILGYQRRYEKYYVTAGGVGIANSALYIFSTCLGLRALSFK